MSEAGPFPWYDAGWNRDYVAAQRILRERRPDSLSDFLEAFRVLHTRPDFETVLLEPFGEADLATIREAVASVDRLALEMNELATMGRFVVHELPTLEGIHRAAAELVSEIVGEDVEPTFRFMGLYTNRGTCPLHIDSPDSKWTLDLCIDQSGPWPIYVSEVVPWPEPQQWEADWREQIKADTAHRFTGHVLAPGQAALFSGSGQWHYRDPIPTRDGLGFCNQLFLQYAPKGTGPLLHPGQWAAHFGIPELASEPS